MGLNHNPHIANCGVFVQAQTWQPPNWWYPQGKHPATDNGYFENMSRIIFQAGLNWNVINKKWTTTKKAFANFSVNKVAQFTDADQTRLMQDQGIVRNRSKIQAIIQNAQLFKEIHQQHGSFKAYLDGLDKTHNYAAVIKELNRRFKRLGPPSASLFLYTVGEPIKHEGWM
jgi:DNA-3-methyladenine glycosylase I